MYSRNNIDGTPNDDKSQFNLEAFVNHWIDFEIIIIFAKWINELLGHLHEVGLYTS